MRTTLIVAALLTGCAQSPEVALKNPATGMVVGCEIPNDHGSTGDFLASRMCVSACEAHGFRPFDGPAPPDDGMPSACLN